MPELPEVETIRRTLLDKNIQGKKVAKIHLPAGRLLRDNPSKRVSFIRSFTGEVISGLERWGKFLLIQGRKHSLLLHFGMSGVIHWKNSSKEHTAFGKHCYLLITFEDGCELAFVDPRTFGRIIPLISARLNQISLKFPKYLKLGPDALLTPTSVLVKKCQEKTHGSIRPIKNVLLDQTIMAGIGNIYADESLFHAKISPLQPAGTLKKKEWIKLILGIKKIFQKALKEGGSTLKDYQRPDGLAGNFQNKFKVYGKSGEPCPRCRFPLKKITLQNRTTVFCFACQK